VSKSVPVGEEGTMPEFTSPPGRRRGESVRHRRARLDPRRQSLPGLSGLRGRRPTSGLHVRPLVSKGTNIGVLMINDPEPNAFEPERLPTMRVLASYLAIAIEKPGCSDW